MTESIKKSTIFQKVFSALSFAIFSSLLTVINKIILTSFNFPSFLFLGLGQILSSIIILYFGKVFNLTQFPDTSKDIIKCILPISVIFSVNMIFGLGGTQSLSIPMYTALRKISVLLTMIFQFVILGKRINWMIQLSVYIMIAGSFLAAIDDLSFNLKGYVFITITNIATSLNQIYIKKRLEQDSNNLGSFGILFYNSLLSLLPTILITWINEDFDKILKFQKWNNIWFIVALNASFVMGLLLNFSTIKCTEYNSALGTSVTGAAKNIVMTYIGMFIGGDYIFSILNFVGLNISAIGAVFYAFTSIRKRNNKKDIDQDTNNIEGKSECEQKPNDCDVNENTKC